MVSSTFADLREHRAALMSAIQGQHLHAVAMETDSARPFTLIESSIEKVRDSAAYIAIIGRRYGSVPECAENPDGLSLTHLEFREAVRLGRPILVFIMSADHLLAESGFEFDPGKRAKLDAFREEAKFAGGDVHQVYKEFNDLASFATAATQSIAELRQMLEVAEPAPVDESDIPAAPALYSRPRYLGSHSFVGREAQLATLSDWARPSGQHAVLLFEAIGGSGKSILTWEWTTRHAPGVRGDWAGRFWYSFYESGAVMSDFCRHALAYMTGKPLTAFRNRNQHELTELLIQQLETNPWLLVLDGLERVLVAYHRLDAAQVPDEQAGDSDEIGSRDPCSAITPQDDDLLRRLAGATPSRILVTSRLVPRVLVNQASQAIPGVLHERLPGLRPTDAEALLRSCGVTGDSTTMRSFLQRHCDCHPLVTGIVAGLVNDYLPARGDFDEWSADQTLDVGDLDLVQKRNHILHTAVSAVEGESRELLSVLALLAESVDYSTLSALNESSDLTRTVRDLERRGLLQYDRQTARYDLHPVVRAVVASGLGPSDRQEIGERLVDHFASRPGVRYDDVTSVDELKDVLALIRSLLQTGRIREASLVYSVDLDAVLRYRFETAAERLTLLRPFFGADWSSPSPELVHPSRFLNYAGDALQKLGDNQQALSLFKAAVRLALGESDQAGVVVNLVNVSVMLDVLDHFAASRRLTWLCIEFAELEVDQDYSYMVISSACRWLYSAGQVEEAERMRRDLQQVGAGFYGTRLRCEAALNYAHFRFSQGALTAEELTRLEATGRSQRLHWIIRGVHRLRGFWLADQNEWRQAAAELAEAVLMARQVGIYDPEAEAWLALAQFHLGQLEAPAEHAVRLASGQNPDHLPLARLWFAIGDAGRAEKHALAAYRRAWADGEPYVRRFDLELAKKILVGLGVEIPVLPPYDPSRDREFEWEVDVRAFIARLREETAGLPPVRARSRQTVRRGTGSQVGGQG
jgi:tetratricopeptide (TPR) repeat protein